MLVERHDVVVTGALQQALFFVGLALADLEFFEIDAQMGTQAARVILISLRDPSGHARSDRNDANAHAARLTGSASSRGRLAAWRSGALRRGAFRRSRF